MNSQAEFQFTFLISSERSGSNLITKIFNNHPEVCGPSPSHLVEYLSEHLWRYGNLQLDSNWERLITDAIDIINTKLAVWQTSVTVSELLAHLKQHTFSSLVSYVYTKEAIANGKQHLFIKERHLHRFAPLLLCAFRQAKYVYLVRDPRDMALSWKRSTRLKGGLLKGCQTWKEEQSEGVRLFSFLNEFDRITIVRYETLLSHTEAEVRRLCDFLKIEYQREMLDFYRDELTINNSLVNPSWENLNKPVMSNNYGKYKAALNEDEIRYIEGLCADEMSFFGYQLDYPITSQLSLLEYSIMSAYKQESEIIEEIPDKERALRLVRDQVIQRIERLSPMLLRIQRR